MYQTKNYADVWIRIRTEFNNEEYTYQENCLMMIQLD
jgi:hypothetical protein